jgi:hypothetical protein
MRSIQADLRFVSDFLISQPIIGQSRTLARCLFRPETCSRVATCVNDSRSSGLDDMSLLHDHPWNTFPLQWKEKTHQFNGFEALVQTISRVGPGRHFIC